MQNIIWLRAFGLSITCYLFTEQSALEQERFDLR